MPSAHLPGLASSPSRSFSIIPNDISRPRNLVPLQTLSIQGQS